jgi:uncharacterized protein YaeQ
MPQKHVMGTVAGRRKAPGRSASAARAHETGDVRWVIDLGQPAAVRVSESVDASRRYALTGLSLLATAVWMLNVAMLVTGGGG